MLAYVIVCAVALLLTVVISNRVKRRKPVTYQRLWTSEGVKHTNGKGNALVIGGSGVLGREIIQQLLAEGTYHVHSLDLSIPPPCRRLVGVASYIQTDITRRRDLERAVEGMEVVFHTASLVPTCIRHTPEMMERVNLGGTENVVGVCQQCGVRRLLYTSSCSVVFGRHQRREEKEDYKEVNEFAPLPKCPLNDYARTKGKAETLVRRVHGMPMDPTARTGMADGRTLRTCALRLAGLIASETSPVTRALINFLVGGGDFYMSWTTLEAAARVHVLADHHLANAGNSLSSRDNVFNVVSGNVKYREMSEFFSLGYRGRRSVWSIPMWVCWMLAYVNESVFWLTGWPPLGTELRRMVLEFICPYTLSTEHTQKVLGWVERRPWREVMEETLHRKY